MGVNGACEVQQQAEAVLLTGDDRPFRESEGRKGVTTEEQQNRQRTIAVSEGGFRVRWII